MVVVQAVVVGVAGGTQGAAAVQAVDVGVADGTQGAAAGVAGSASPAGEIVGEWGSHKGVMTKDGSFGFAFKATLTLFVMTLASTIWLILMSTLSQDWDDASEYFVDDNPGAAIFHAALAIFFASYLVHELALVCSLKCVRSPYIKLMMVPCINYIVLLAAACAFGIIMTRLSFAHYLLYPAGFVPPLLAIVTLWQLFVLWINDDLQTPLNIFLIVLIGMISAIAIGVAMAWKNFEPVPDHCYWNSRPMRWGVNYDDCEVEADNTSEIPFYIFMCLVEVAIPVIGFGMGISLNMISVFRPETARVTCLTSDVKYTTRMHALLALDMFFEILNAGVAFLGRSLGAVARQGHRRRPDRYDGTPVVTDDGSHAADDET